MQLKDLSRNSTERTGLGGPTGQREAHISLFVRRWIEIVKIR